MEVIRVVYSHGLAFIPKLKLDTEGFCCGFMAPEDEETNKPVQKKQGHFPSLRAGPRTTIRLFKPLREGHG